MNSNYNLWYELFKLSLKGMNADTDGNCNDSGEEGIIKHMNIRSGGVMFDVGANIGTYTKLLLNSFPNSTVYSFEPSVKTYEKLKENVSDVAKVQCLALSDKEGNVTLYYDKEESGMASLYERDLSHYGLKLNNSEVVRVSTIDKFCSENEISTIDFLKMDIEGNEYKALLGAERMLSNKAIKAIQIEFGGCNIDSRTFFRDFWNLLSEQYDVYRILNNGVHKIGRYTERLETFMNTNYFFALKGENIISEEENWT